MIPVLCHFLPLTLIDALLWTSHIIFRSSTVFTSLSWFVLPLRKNRVYMSTLECLFYSTWFIHYLSLHFNENSLVSDSDYSSKGLFSEVPFEYNVQENVFTYFFFLFYSPGFPRKRFGKASLIWHFPNWHFHKYSWYYLLLTTLLPEC